MDHSLDNNHLSYNLLIALIVLLWPTDIGPEPLLSMQESKKNSSVNSQVEVPQQQLPLKLPTKFPLKHKIHQDSMEIDEELFLKSFKRQAQKNLLDCLRVNYSDKKSLILNAEMTKHGKLQKISSPLETQDLPQCVKDSISEMDFMSLAVGMKRDSIALSWKVNW